MVEIPIQLDKMIKGYDTIETSPLLELTKEMMNNIYQCSVLSDIKMDIKSIIRRQQYKITNLDELHEIEDKILSNKYEDFLRIYGSGSISYGKSIDIAANAVMEFFKKVKFHPEIGLTVPAEKLYNTGLSTIAYYIAMIEYNKMMKHYILEFIGYNYLIFEIPKLLNEIKKAQSIIEKLEKEIENTYNNLISDYTTYKSIERYVANQYNLFENIWNKNPNFPQYDKLMKRTKNIYRVFNDEFEVILYDYYELERYLNLLKEQQPDEYNKFIKSSKVDPIKYVSIVEPYISKIEEHVNNIKNYSSNLLKFKMKLETENGLLKKLEMKDRILDGAFKLIDEGKYDTYMSISYIIENIRNTNKILNIFFQGFSINNVKGQTYESESAFVMNVSNYNLDVYSSLITRGLI